MGGDFNAKHTYWGSRLTTTKGRELYDAAKKTGCEFVSTGKPTYWPTDVNKIPDLVDFFVINKLSRNFIQVQEGLDLDSDHSPIYLTLSETVIVKEENPYLSNKFTDWLSFKHILKDKINISTPIETTDQLENEAYSFIQLIQFAAWSCTPPTKRKTVGANYPKEIKELIR